MTNHIIKKSLVTFPSKMDTICTQKRQPYVEENEVTLQLKRCFVCSTCTLFCLQQNTAVETSDFYCIVQVFHPYRDDMTALVIRLCSLDASYIPRVDGQGPGSVAAPKGKHLTIVPFAWTVLQLFSK